MAYEVHLVDRFPEPEFSALASSVFSGLETPSAQMSAVRREETELSRAAPSAQKHPEMVRFGAYAQGKLVGWSYGWPEREGVFYMANSAVVPEYRRQGIYSRLVGEVLQYTRTAGLASVRSRHLCTNNRVIIAKLKLGFHITGMEFSEQFGPLVRLVHFHGAERSRLFQQRASALSPERQGHENGG